MMQWFSYCIKSNFYFKKRKEFGLLSGNYLISHWYYLVLVLVLCENKDSQSSAIHLVNMSILGLGQTSICLLENRLSKEKENRF